MSSLTTYNLVGAGGTGSFLLPALLRYLDTHHFDSEWRLQLIDGDHFTSANRDRQLFDGRYAEENKALALAHMHNDTRVVAIEEYLGADNIPELIQPGDITLIAADNYTVRARLNDHLLSMTHGAIINGGNEQLDGSCQIFWRRAITNMTPPLSFLHPEIKVSAGEDRAEMDCLVASQLPGGGQTIVANLMSAVTMLNALRMLHEYLPGGEHTEITVHEIHFDLATARMKPADWRGVDGWK